MTDAAAREQTDTEAGTDNPDLRVPFSAGESLRASRMRGRLLKLITAKLALDLLFVCGLAIYTHAVTLNRGLEGELEHADGLSVSGWVADLEHPGSPVEVQLFLDGRFAASVLAGEPQNDGHRGFVFRFEQPRYGEHDARVYAVSEGRGGTRRTLQQLGKSSGFIWK